jgi:hypothetical protein
MQALFKNLIDDTLYDTHRWDYITFFEDTLVTLSYMNENRTIYSSTLSAKQMFFNYLEQVEVVLGNPANVTSDNEKYSAAFSIMVCYIR